MVNKPAFTSEDALGFGETFWRTHYLWLKENGYQLRPRYSPDWTPSWKGTTKFSETCEDGIGLLTIQICDATHIPSGAQVCLKHLRKKNHPFEEDIQRFLTSQTMLSDPQNHCVPLLDVLIPPNDNPDTHPDSRILVMPLLRPFDSPIFDTFGEAVECIRQLFEGLQFMHEHHVAHRDVKMNNFMMEPNAMFPEGYHPQRFSFRARRYGLMRKLDLSGPAKFFTRIQRPPKYYLIDFGVSRQYDASNTCPLEPPILGGDGTVPEFKPPYEPQNPYWTDVYCVGNLVRQYFIEGHPVLTHIRGYEGFDFLKPLIDDMVQDDPSQRPTMAEVLRRFDLIVNQLSSWKLRSRTRWRRANIFQNFAHIVSHWRRRMVFVVTRTPAIPRPRAPKDE